MNDNADKLAKLRECADTLQRTGYPVAALAAMLTADLLAALLQVAEPVPHDPGDDPCDFVRCGHARREHFKHITAGHVCNGCTSRTVAHAFVERLAEPAPASVEAASVDRTADAYKRGYLAGEERERERTYTAERELAELRAGVADAMRTNGPSDDVTLIACVRFEKTEHLRYMREYARVTDDLSKARGALTAAEGERDRLRERERTLIDCAHAASEALAGGVAHPGSPAERAREALAPVRLWSYPVTPQDAAALLDAFDAQTRELAELSAFVEAVRTARDWWNTCEADSADEQFAAEVHSELAALDRAKAGR